MLEKLDLLKNLDYFSTTYSLNIGGKAAMRSFVGLLFTSVYFGVMVAITVTNLNDYFDHTNPIAVADSYTTEKYPKVNLLKQKITPVLVGFSNETDWIKAEDMSKYFTFVVQKITWASHDSNGEQSLVKTFDTFETLPCSKMTSKELEIFNYIDKASYFGESINGYGMCVRFPENLTVEGKGADDFFTLLTIKVLPCSLGPECKSYAEITKANFQLILPSVNFNASNSANPMQYAITVDDIYYVHPMFKQTYTGKMKQRTVMDLTGFFSRWTERESVFALDNTVLTLQYRSNVTSCTAQQVATPDNPDCLPYFEYNIQSSGIVLVNKRTYPSTTDTLGTIGGTSRVVFFILILIYIPINDYQRKNYVISTIYPLLNERDVQLGKQMYSPSTYEIEKMDSARRKPEELPYKPSSIINKVAPSLPEKALTTTWNQAKMPSKSLPRKDDDDGDGLRRTSRKFTLVEGLRRSITNARMSMKSKNFFKTMFGWCYCKRKSASEIELDKKLEKAYNRINDSLDVVSIIRNFNLLKVLSHLLLEERHFDLAQYVGFDLWSKEGDILKAREKEEREALAEFKHANTLEKDEAQQRTFIYLEKKRFKKWLSYLGSHKLHSHKKGEEVKPRITSLIDDFYFGHLVETFTEEKDFGHVPELWDREMADFSRPDPTFVPTATELSHNPDFLAPPIKQEYPIKSSISKVEEMNEHEIHEEEEDEHKYSGYKPRVKKPTKIYVKHLKIGINTLEQQ